MILSDRDIRDAIDAEHINIDPFIADHLQPSSYDVRVGHEFRVFHNHMRPFIDPREPSEDLTSLVEIVDPENAFLLHPGEFALGVTMERIGLDDRHVARLEGKSSLGRLGLLIHSTAGYFDPGFTGVAVLELSNVSNLPIKIWPGMKIGQFNFTRLLTPCERPYGSAGLGSKYQGQRGPVASRFHENES